MNFMKITKVVLLGITMLFSWGMLLTSCSEDGHDPIAPTIQFTAEVDGPNVTVTAVAANAESYLWDYGDGNTSTTYGNHTYTYSASGDYTIEVTVTSIDNLTASWVANVSIAASIEEMIAGSGTGGKTWVLTQAESSYSGKNGVGLITNDVAFLPGKDVVPDGVLSIFGLGDEYNDEFTFDRDGTFKVDTKNDRGLAGIVYANVVSPNDKAESTDATNLPLASIPFSNVDNGTWELSYNDRTVEWYDAFVTNSVQSTTFTFSENDPNKVAEIKISSGAYLGIDDLYYPDPIATALGLPAPVDNSLYILKEVTANEMHIAVAINTWPGKPYLPSLMMHLTLVPK